MSHAKRARSATESPKSCQASGSRTSRVDDRRKYEYADGIYLGTMLQLLYGPTPLGTPTSTRTHSGQDSNAAPRQFPPRWLVSKRCQYEPQKKRVRYLPSLVADSTTPNAARASFRRRSTCSSWAVLRLVAERYASLARRR